MSTPTPRTDAKLLTVAQRTSPHYLPEMVWADFARELERELAAERETSRLLKVAMDARDEGYTQSRRHMSALERDLAAERARLDYLSTRGFEHRHHETGDHLAYEWTISSTNELKDVSLREVIDAAMKEDAK